MAFSSMIRMSSDIIFQSFRVNLCIMKIFHLYPPEEKTRCWYKIETIVIYLLFMVAVPTLSVLYLLLEDSLDMERVNYNGGFLAQTIGFIGKFLPFIINSVRIKRCIHYLESFSLTLLHNEQSSIIIDECIRICKRNTLVFLISSVGAVGSWATKPMFGKDRIFPVDVWLPFDSTKEIYTYLCVYIFVAIGPIVASISTGAIDPLIAGLAYHATCQLKILNENLQYLDEYVDQELSKKVKESTKHELIYKKIKQCVVHHDTVLSFVKEFEICFSWVVFSQIGASVFVVCFLCLQLSKVEPSGFYFVQMIAYFSVILGEIYFYCYYGSTISKESDSVTNAIYMSKWYNYDIKSKKALLILMKRSKEQLIVKSGKTVDLSLETFTTILRRSYSLLALLKNYQ